MIQPGFLLVTTFGLGYLRPAPGSWGSLPPVLLAAGLIAAGVGPQHAPWLYHALLVVVLLLFSLSCLVMGDRAEARYLRKDPSAVVADETAGQCIPLAFLPPSALDTPSHVALTLLLAFVAFRAADILKPWPARGLQRHPAGLGILLDDLVAGVYAACLVQVVTRVAW